MMKLAVKERETANKGDVKRVRRAGSIPAVVYAPGRPNRNLVVDNAEFSALLRGVQPGQLPATPLMLDLASGKMKVVIKDIQYDVTSYRVSHVDFEELIEDVPVSVKVPVRCTGVAECVGVKLGGFLRQVIRHVTVECLPKQIPGEFVIDVADLGIKQSKRLGDLIMPKGVRALAKMDQVIVVIAKRAS